MKIAFQKTCHLLLIQEDLPSFDLYQLEERNSRVKHDYELHTGGKMVISGKQRLRFSWKKKKETKAHGTTSHSAREKHVTIQME